MGIQVSWDDSRRVLKLRLAEGSKMLPPMLKKIDVTIDQSRRQIEFTGKPLEIQL
jgi:hypothetical protein